MINRTGLTTLVGRSSSSVTRTVQAIDPELRNADRSSGKRALPSQDADTDRSELVAAILRAGRIRRAEEEGDPQAIDDRAQFIA